MAIANIRIALACDSQEILVVLPMYPLGLAGWVELSWENRQPLRAISAGGRPLPVSIDANRGTFLTQSISSNSDTYELE